HLGIPRQQNCHESGRAERVIGAYSDHHPARREPRRMERIVAAVARQEKIAKIAVLSSIAAHARTPPGVGTPLRPSTRSTPPAKFKDETRRRQPSDLVRKTETRGSQCERNRHESWRLGRNCRCAPSTLSWSIHGA